MKGRAFAAVVLSVLLLLSGLGIGGWWLLWNRGPLELAHHPLSMPRAARFVPASASFSLYLFSDGQRPVDYARAVAPARQRRRAGEVIARLRDGAFAAAGLDYADELSGWLGDELAMALFDDPVARAGGDAGQGPSQGWLLALSSRDDDGARRFLQRFWQTRSLAGTDLQVSRYRGMGLISGRGALLGSRPEPLATALVDDDLVLIASGRNLLERALDVSQITELNQAGQPQLRQGLSGFATGAALAVASPAALHDWFGLPVLPAPAAGSGMAGAAIPPAGPVASLPSASPGRSGPSSEDGTAGGDAAAAGDDPPAEAAVPAATASEPPRSSASAEPREPTPSPALASPAGPALLAVLQPDGRQLRIRARLALPGVPHLEPLSPRLADDLLDGLHGSPVSLALVQNPSALAAVPLLRPLLQRSLALSPAPAAERDGSLAPLLAGTIQGPLLFSEGKPGWLLAARSDDPPDSALEPLLQREGLLEAPLTVEGHSLRVWTRLSLDGRPGRRDRAASPADQLQASLAGWREQRQSFAWWGQSLTELEPVSDGRSLEGLRRRLSALDSPTAPLQWSLDGGGARTLLRGWQPWRLLSALAGGGLDGPVRGLALAVEGRPEPSVLEMRARLDLGT